MNKDRSEMADRILNLTIEIIYLLTGEDYLVVKRIPEEGGRWNRSQNPITGPQPHSQVHEGKNYQEILKLTNRITELLTGEVPVRYQDVSISLSMEEWEYLERHKDQYEDIMMECDQTPTSPVKSCKTLQKEGPPDRCPSTLYDKDYLEENQNRTQDYRDTNLSDIKVVEIKEEQERYVSDTQLHKKDEIPSDVGSNGCTKNVMGHLLLSPVYGVNNMKEGNGEGNATALLTTNVLFVLHSRDLSTANHRKLPSGQLQTVQQSTDVKMFPCFECGKCFKRKSILSMHQRIHRDERPYSCSECGKCFRQKSDLMVHLRRHTGEKPYSCSECGKRFIQKSVLVTHQKIHTGEKPFSCSECGKCFTQRSDLVNHHLIHTGEKPFSCLECGKCYNHRSALAQHKKRIHNNLQTVANVIPQM
ncbi:oocyte zinc finger protein XlCOF8.4-like [Dendropsophus ebraccatus]|uniref:oocyte zinc finger protein XlCOF8.4-like n=1 Tax=Dendropsophus ebraccatus TaxID=150705 RepID=UPI0038318040